MLTGVSRIITAMLALSLIPGCRGLESEARSAATSDARLAVPDDVRASDTETSRAPRARRKPKTQIETSLTDGDGLTFGTARVSVAAMLPVNPPDRMLLVKPNFAAHSLASPLDTPSRLYSAGINMMWLEKLNDRTMLTIAVNPALSGDDVEFGRHLRVFAMGAVGWDWIPDALRVTAGAAWLGRRDIGVVPAAGLEWTPNDDWNVSLILPRPRVSRRLFVSETSEAWLYAAGSLNGGTFDVRRGDGSADELSLREFQTSVGVELTNSQIGRGFLEVGAGFGRELQFESSQDAVSFDPGLALRLGLTR
jgi:hypothetical protein